jgi:hypothetical protein
MSIINQLRKLYRSQIPKPIRDFNTQLYFKFRRIYFKKKIISFLYSKGVDNLTEEERKVLEYLESNNLAVFPYEFQDKYWNMDIKIQHDSTYRLNYILIDDKKLFFKRGMSNKKILKMFRGLNIEQDPKSPHRYLTDFFELKNNSVVYDVGAAEGSFSLKHIESIDKLFVFETDPLWAEALRATFHPWNRKVKIIEKFVSDSVTNNKITLDQFTKNNPPPDFVKIDVDGEEMNLLKGFNDYLSKIKKSVKIAICTYHKQNDESEIGAFLSKREFNHNPSEGYMIFYFDQKFNKPYLRRGLLRAEKLIEE